MQKNIKSLFIALGCGVVSIFLVNYYITSKEAALLELSTPVKVVSAVRDIPEGSRLEDGMFEIVDVPKKYVQSGAILNVDQVRDQISSVPILTGNQVLGSMLAKSQDIGLSRRIPQGKTAQTISVNNVSGIAGLLQPGDFVDLIVSVEVVSDDNSGTTETISKKFLKNVQILAVDQRSHRSTSSAMGAMRNTKGSRFLSTKSATGFGSNQGIATITLGLEEKQVLPVTVAQQVGEISVALRSAWDSGKKNADNSTNEEELSSLELLGIDRPIANDYYEVFSRANRTRVTN